jgi:hypothetical protein
MGKGARSTRPRNRRVLAAVKAIPVGSATEGAITEKLELDMAEYVEGLCAFNVRSAARTKALGMRCDEFEELLKSAKAESDPAAREALIMRLRAMKKDAALAW